MHYKGIFGMLRVIGFYLTVGFLLCIVGVFVYGMIELFSGKNSWDLVVGIGLLLMFIGISFFGIWKDMTKK